MRVAGSARAGRGVRMGWGRCRRSRLRPRARYAPPPLPFVLIGHAASFTPY